MRYSSKKALLNKNVLSRFLNSLKFNLTISRMSRISQIYSTILVVMPRLQAVCSTCVQPIATAGTEISSRPVACGDQKTIRATNFWKSLALLATFRKKEPAQRLTLLKSPQRNSHKRTHNALSCYQQKCNLALCNHDALLVIQIAIE